MKKEIGKQYEKDDIMDSTGFRSKARMHQSTYRANVLDVDFDEYGNRLTKEDGLSGLNFYNGFDIFKAVRSRYKKYKKGLYSDMLRSEHIPFNLFIPLEKDKQYCIEILNVFLGESILSVDEIKIEYAPSPAKKYLKDKTSFDVYIEYTHIDGKKGIIGIEVKYTEHEYALKEKSKEARYIDDLESVYYDVTKKSEIYHYDAIEKLKTNLYRQIWRNHILGESILQEDNKFGYFTLLTIFPKGNTHFVETSKKYIELLNNNKNFIPITYEEFIQVAQEHCPNENYNNWINYLIKRYIVE